jgi:anti-sigma regulatory factor (Ser/Thr protein kinase)
MSESGESLTGPGFLPAPVTWTAARIAPAAAAVPPRLACGQGEGDGPPPVPPFRHVPSGLAGEWTMGSYLELGALPSAVPCARLHARLLLQEWGLAGLSPDVELLVSELVTNGLQASRSLRHVAPVRMYLPGDAARVLILVWDASLRPPTRIDPGADTERGRGLLLVEAISSRWGWYPAQEPGGGKVVWALAVAPSR